MLMLSGPRELLILLCLMASRVCSGVTLIGECVSMLSFCTFAEKTVVHPAVDAHLAVS